MNDGEIVALARQSQRWLYAARQDGDLVVRHLHLNYGVGDLDLLAETASPERIRSLTGLDIAAAREDARAEQDRVQRQLIARLQQCQPQPAPSDLVGGRDTMRRMFDVVRLGQTDLDLLPWLREREEIREGYVLLEMQQDPTAPTTLHLHVLGPNEPGYYEGRDPVVRKLVTMWDRPAHRAHIDIPLPPIRPAGQAAQAVVSTSGGWIKPALIAVGAIGAVFAAFYFLVSTAQAGEVPRRADRGDDHLDQCARWMSLTYPEKRAAIEPFFAERIESGLPMEQSIDEAIRDTDQRCVQSISAQWQ